uniref:HMG box domain-containing protein n=1 Tax=Ditylenchus dipsaci TaxID=166011 RepID=A0A915EQV0_9BILA
MSYINAVRQLLTGFCRTKVQTCNFYAAPSGFGKKARLPPGYDETFGIVLTKAAWVWKQLDEPTKADYVKRAREITEERKLAFENLPDPEKDELMKQHKEKKELEKANKAVKKVGPSEHAGRYIFIREFCERKPKAESAEEREILFDQAMKSWDELSPESREVFNNRAIEQKMQSKKKEPAGTPDSPDVTLQKKKPFYAFKKTKQTEGGPANPKIGTDRLPNASGNPLSLEIQWISTGIPVENGGSTKLPPNLLVVRWNPPICHWISTGFPVETMSFNES